MKLNVWQENDKFWNLSAFLNETERFQKKSQEQSPTFELQNTLVEQRIAKYRTTYLSEHCASWTWLY